MKLRRIRADLQASMLLWSRYPMRIVLGFATPALFLLLLSATFGTPGPLVLHAYDEDQSPASQALLDALAKSGNLDVIPVDDPPNASHVSDWMKDQRAAGLLWIPAGYGQGLGSNSTSVPVRLYIDQDPGSVGPALQANVNAIVAGEELHARGVNGSVHVEPASVDTGEIPYREFLVSGMVGLNVLSVSLFGMVGATSAFRYSGLFRKLATTPLRKSEWIVSKPLFQPLVALLGSVALVAIALLVFRPEIHLTVLGLSLVIAGALALSGIGLVIATAIRDTEVVSLVANIVYLPMMFLSGTFFPLGSLPEPLQYASRALPLTYLTEGLRAEMVLGDSQVALVSLAILLAVTVACIIVGSALADWSQE